MKPETVNTAKSALRLALIKFNASKAECDELAEDICAALQHFIKLQEEGRV